MTLPTFRHEAMATWFELTVAGQEAAYAQQAAAAAFRELDRLESELSRFVESSDIARANRLAAGEATAIGHDALECLLLAAGLAEATGRTFNPAYASEPLPGADPTEPLFTIDPEAHRLTSRAARLQLDLGAVGKGYALDRMADLLGDWGIESACLNSGGSTALVLAAPPGESGWALRVGDVGGTRAFRLTQAALSGSGTAVKGAHVFDPQTGLPARRATRTWALAPGAAMSDALSTAFFVMPDEAIAAFCAGHPEVGGAWTRADGSVEVCGAFTRAPAIET